MQKVIDFITNEIGMTLPISNKQRVEKYISVRLLELSLNCTEFISLLQSNISEYNDLIDQITVNETYLFREEKHFSILQNKILPELKEGNRLINIWSACCSTGEEAISLYYLSKSIFKNDNKFMITASDINKKALEKLKEGKLTENSFREDGKIFHNLIKNRSVIDPLIISKLIINNININSLDEKEYVEKFDIVFLRNTLIYFTKMNKDKIIDSVVNRLKVGGYLFCSATETPFVTNSQLEIVADSSCFYFKKVKFKEKCNKKVLKIVNPPKKIDKGLIKNSLDYLEVLKLSRVILLNEDLKIQESPELKYARSVIKFFYLLDMNDFEFAILEMNKIPNNNALKHYMLGYISYLNKNEEKAFSEFRNATQLDREFWPAIFYLATITKSQKYITSCIDFIDLYIEKEYFYFQVLLDGFNANYFKKICQNWLK